MKSLSAVVLTILCSLFAVSCVLDAEPTPDESTGEAQEQLPAFGGFDASDFPFVTLVGHHGGGAGGWQEAKANLHFWRLTFPRRLRRWDCSVTVGMPLRSTSMGKISSKRAAAMSAKLATEAMRPLDYKRPTAMFCRELREKMEELFALRYPKLGARVK
ncbi:hypothetical protein WMF28_28700 [Sorangium sp. So ce590]|uniref:hypothetical protein n=1 Tax=Sorangium sp. So ce590 TaxID=3133317 RepID=UPI003F610F34